MWRHWYIAFCLQIDMTVTNLNNLQLVTSLILLCCFRAVVVFVFSLCSLFLPLVLHHGIPLLLIFSSCKAKHINTLTEKVPELCRQQFLLFMRHAHHDWTHLACFWEPQRLCDPKDNCWTQVSSLKKKKSFYLVCERHIVVAFINCSSCYVILPLCTDLI